MVITNELPDDIVATDKNFSGEAVKVYTELGGEACWSVSDNLNIVGSSKGNSVTVSPKRASAQPKDAWVQASYKRGTDKLAITIQIPSSVQRTSENLSLNSLFYTAFWSHIVFHNRVTDQFGNPIAYTLVNERINITETHLTSPFARLRTGSGYTDGNGFFTDDYARYFISTSGYVASTQTYSIGNWEASWNTVQYGDGSWTGDWTATFH
jgi:hypothetical protein